MPRAKTETAKFKQVLEYFDGPQAILLERKAADVKLVAVAIDKEGYENPFFAAEVSYEQWERYCRGYVDLRYLFLFPRWREWYLFDFNGDNMDEIQLHRTTRDNHADEHYIPAAGFFSYNHSEPIIRDLPGNLATQKYLTDGKWALPDFTQFYNKLNDLYCFFMSLKLYTAEFTSLDRKKLIREAFAGHPLRGGSSYNNLYADLASAQTFDEKIAIGKLQYASAGEVDVRGSFDVFGEIAVAHNELMVNYDELKRQYNDIYSYLRKNKLLKNESDRFDVDGAIASYVLRLGSKFAADMRVPNTELILELSGRNPLIFTKILLSYFRRLERYFMFFAEGRVKDPELRR